MLKLLHRWESDWKSIGISWRERDFGRGGIQFVLRHPAKGHDCEIPFRFILKMIWGPGAGYKGGRTAFLAINCKDLMIIFDPQLGEYRRQNPAGDYVHTPIQCNFTQNAHIVPYPY